MLQLVEIIKDVDVCLHRGFHQQMVVILLIVNLNIDRQHQRTTLAYLLIKLS